MRRRERERRLRLRCLAVARWATWMGWSDDRFADTLGIETRTLRGWSHLVGAAAQPQGAPPMRATPAERQAVARFIALWQGACSFRDLAEHFPDLARHELANLYWAYAIAHRDDHALCLRWNTPGAVWAIDYSYADHDIDGIYPFLLIVRDVASGAILAALPCPDATARHAVGLIDSLVAQHGAPLVLKSDNGSHFINRDLRIRLNRLGIVCLVSPPYYPRYNGACEAGIGALKTRIHHRAVRDGHPDRWTTDHVEAARHDANHRDWREPGRTPEQVWAASYPITAAQRCAFHRAVLHGIQRQCLAADQLPLDRQPPAHTLIRRGIADALVGLGHLAYRSRPVTQPVQDGKVG